jgi:hypothetical protein
MTEHAFTAVLNAKRFSQDDSFSLCHSRESGNPELMVWARKEEKARNLFDGRPLPAVPIDTEIKKC